MTVTQYETRFVDLARHVIVFLPTEKEKVRRFIDGLTYTIKIQMDKETRNDISFQTTVNIARRIELVCSQERGLVSYKRHRHFGNFRGASSGGRDTYSRGYPPRPFYSALQASQLQLQQPQQQDVCYECGNIGHIRRYFPRLSSNRSQQDSRAIIPAPVAPPLGRPARGRGQTARGGGQVVRGGGQPVRGRPRDVAPSDGAQPQFYAFSVRPKAESSDVVITGSTYYYVSSYFASYLVVPHDSLSVSIHVSMPVGDSITVDNVYHSCVVTIGSLETSVDLLLLDMVDFDIILGMDWLSPYYDVLDCHAKTVTLAMSGLPRIEWKRTLAIPPARLFFT
ncbi:uncharacterized protein [Nicotiana tomentosiformis]|uniref:uncharacterized protein n=1 Tax=Nicotiana tomentosiformis TaxID=4098 RepID=UPI00388CEBFA